MTLTISQQWILKVIERGYARDMDTATVANAICDGAGSVPGAQVADTYWLAQVMCQTLPDQLIHVLYGQLAIYLYGDGWPHGRTVPRTVPVKEALTNGADGAQDDGH